MNCEVWCWKGLAEAGTTAEADCDEGGQSTVKIAHIFLRSKLLIALVLPAAATLGAFALDSAKGAARHGKAGTVYAGFDKNDYPGDDLLLDLHKTFAFTGYWLNNPPGLTSNPWAGKRSLIRSRGFGFVILFNGRLYSELNADASGGQDAVALGRRDAADAIAAAHREGFPVRAILFLDQEEGGHLLPQQSAYLHAWIGAVEQSKYRPGVYCSGIAISATDHATTAEDILSYYKPGGESDGRPSRRVQGGEFRHTPHPPALWVANDRCPPAPGCTVPAAPPAPALSGLAAATLWQYAQSPRRAQFTAACAASYGADDVCHAPALPSTPETAIDLDTATSPDPSHGR